MKLWNDPNPIVAVQTPDEGMEWAVGDKDWQPDEIKAIREAGPIGEYTSIIVIKKGTVVARMPAHLVMVFHKEPDNEPEDPS